MTVGLVVLILVKLVVIKIFVIIETVVFASAHLFTYGLSTQCEQFFQLCGGHLGEPVFAGSYNACRQFFFLLNHGIDAFFQRADANEFVYLHVALLSNAESSISGLILHSGVPPAIKMEDVIGRREIEADAARLERENEEARTAFILLKALHHQITLLFGCAAVQEERFIAQLLL